MAVTENLLRHATSPYLLQHATNPVHWRPWGPDALAEAVAANRPILLSIGYAACHWCHVMAHESFEDPDTAALMNALYVNIKLDREERPDIDHLYMSALHVLGEQGGWPLTMFLTPQGDPFWGGTYFPPEPRWGKPSFRQVLQGVADAFRDEKTKIHSTVAGLRAALATMAAEHPGTIPTPATLDHAVAALLRAVDPVAGGLMGAPKFPNPPIFRLLWQDSFRTGHGAGAQALHLLLRRMSQGGIYDHLGGGYARYSTDAEWLAPHFEKMLYDNAQILELLALAHAGRPNALYAARAEQTVDWLLRDMTAQQVNGRAAFAASEDADSEGEEGRFYVWTEAEIDAALGAASPAFKAAYDVSAAGNWEGHTILRRVAPPGDAAAEKALADARATLFAWRARRIRPGRDDKVLADWNALTVTALCRAAGAFARPDWIVLAGAAFDFLRIELGMPDGRIAHAWRLGRITAPGLLDDQASMARAALALYEATGDRARLDQACALVAVVERWFADPAAGSFFTTAADATDIPLGTAARPRISADNVTPSGNGVMAEVLARLHHLTGEAAFRERATAVLSAYGGLGENLTTVPTLLAATDLLEAGAVVVITGPADAPATRALLATALAAPDPAVCVLRATTPQDLPSSHPAYGKTTGAGSAAYLCRAGTCGLPMGEPATLATALRARRPASA